MSSPENFKTLEVYPCEDGVVVSLSWKSPIGTLISLSDRLNMIHEQVNQVHRFALGLAWFDLEGETHVV